MIMVGPPLWWGLLCTYTLCTLGNPALVLVMIRVAEFWTRWTFEACSDSQPTCHTGLSCSSPTVHRSLSRILNLPCLQKCNSGCDIVLPDGSRRTCNVLSIATPRLRTLVAGLTLTVMCACWTVGSSHAGTDHDGFGLVWVHGQATEIKPVLVSIETVWQCRGRCNIIECVNSMRVDYFQDKQNVQCEQQRTQHRALWDSETPKEYLRRHSSVHMLMVLKANDKLSCSSIHCRLQGTGRCRAASGAVQFLCCSRICTLTGTGCNLAMAWCVQWVWPRRYAQRPWRSCAGSRSVSSFCRHPCPVHLFSAAM